MASISSRDMVRIIFVPAVITLAVTLLRLAGELNGWSSVLFSSEAGGGGALVGIVWLPPIFGIYFALKLRREGQEPAGAGRIALYALMGLVAVFVIVTITQFAGIPLPFNFILMALAGIAGVAVSMRGWPALGKTLALYGLAARLPIVIITFFAVSGNWGTHYDAPPPDFPEGLGVLSRFILAGVIPQLTVWIAYTIIVGALFAALALKIAPKKQVAPQIA